MTYVPHDRLTVSPAAVDVWPHTYTPVGAVFAAACNICWMIIIPQTQQSNNYSCCTNYLHVQLHMYIHTHVIPIVELHKIQKQKSYATSCICMHAWLMATVRTHMYALTWLFPSPGSPTINMWGSPLIGTAFCIDVKTKRFYLWHSHKSIVHTYYMYICIHMYATILEQHSVYSSC